MSFDIDFTRYRVVDLSQTVRPNQTIPGRPFEVREGRLEDGTYKHDIINTHTHVGTHVESPWHFYRQGRTCTDYPIEKFMGRAFLLRARTEDGQETVTLESVRRALESRRGQFSALFVRNDDDRIPLRIEMECVEYFAGFGLDLLAFDSTIAFGHGLEDGRRFHDLMLGGDTLLAEFPDNAAMLDRDEFFLFAVPIKYDGMDAAPCRMFAIVER